MVRANTVLSSEAISVFVWRLSVARGHFQLSTLESCQLDGTAQTAAPHTAEGSAPIGRAALLLTKWLSALRLHARARVCFLFAVHPQAYPPTPVALAAPPRAGIQLYC